MGWNGIKLHCQGKTYELAKGKTFTSDIKDADIMIDVHDSRVLVQWPRVPSKDSAETGSEQPWGDETPTRSGTARRNLQGSPLGARRRLGSPLSPSPAVQSLIPPSSPLFTPSHSRKAVVVYEDEPSPSRRPQNAEALASQLTQLSSQKLGALLQTSQSSDLSDSSKADDFSDHNEENDPIILSFGPFGENLLPRMASFTAGSSPVRSARSPRRRMSAQPLQPTQSPKQSVKTADRTTHSAAKADQEDDETTEKIRNHAVNQLAFSRLSSTPFSIILSNLPPGLWKQSDSKPGLRNHEIRQILDTTKCIGKVAREGKDAAGKPLESEYYYIPDRDDDELRREAVVTDLRKPGLRNCRKQHKVGARRTNSGSCLRLTLT